jgi:hypothetical protein
VKVAVFLKNQTAWLIQKALAERPTILDNLPPIFYALTFGAEKLFSTLRFASPVREGTFSPQERK